MTANPHDHVTLAEFEAFLEIYGANRSRWPAQKRLAFAALLASSEAARHRLAEADALDRLLETVDDDPAPKMTRASERLLGDRIVEAALAESAALQSSEGAGSEGPRVMGQSSASNVVRLKPVPAPRRRALWPVGAMMAASLLLGLTTGLTTVTKIGTGYDTAAAETATDAALDPAVIALDNDSFGPLSGDIL